MSRTTLAALCALTAALCLAPATSADATRTIRVEVPHGSEAVAIENLVGTMKIAPGNGDKIVAVATVHAESEELAATVRFERVSETNRTAYRVRYPYDRVNTFRYGDLGGSGSGFGWQGSSNTNTTYDDHKVKISNKSGTLLYADVEIQVPRSKVNAAFRNVAGRMDAHDLQGKLAFEVASGRIVLADLSGDSKVESGSGDIDASAIQGTIAIETGSGDCNVRNFKGERLAIDTGSGDLRIESPSATKISIETGSGDIKVTDADTVDFSADTGSGDVDFTVSGHRLANVSAETGSGDVTVRLPRDSSFEAIADQGSGDLDNKFSDAQPIVKGREVIGYRRGDGKSQISVETGSGDFSIGPN